MQEVIDAGMQERLDRKRLQLDRDVALPGARRTVEDREVSSVQRR
jgi:hypothetical protein